MSKIARRLRPKTVNYEPFKIEIDQVALRYRNNVKSIIKFAKENGIAIVLIKQPMTAEDRRPDSPISYEAEYQAVMERFRTNAFLSTNQLLLIKHHRLIEELEKIAKEERLPIVDNIAIVDRNGGGLASWVHLTEEASLRLAEAIKSAVEPYLKNDPLKQCSKALPLAPRQKVAAVRCYESIAYNAKGRATQDEWRNWLGASTWEIVQDV